MRADRLRALGYLPSVVLVTYFIALVCLVGFLTNWFRYVPSLEATFVMRAMVVPTILVIVLFFVGRKLRSPLVTTLMLVAVVGVAVGLTSTAIREAFGTLRKPALDHVEKNRDQVVRFGNRTLVYHLELVNPYSRTARSVLVLREGQAERRIEVPLFKRRTAAYVVADHPADWIRMVPTSRADVLELQTTSRLREARFEVDLRDGSAREIP